MAGNLLVGQSGGGTAVINASLAGVLAEAGRQQAAGRLYGALHGVLGLLENDTVPLDGADPAFLRRLARTPAAALGSCRHQLAGDEIEQALATLRRLEIRFLLYIGGNDSAQSSLALARAARSAGYELHVAGVPKTVDNDLPGMDHTPGFGSAARLLASAVMDAGLDTLAMRPTDPVKVIEVGGRNAGWLAAAASLGRQGADTPPHLVYLPEQSVSLDRMVADVERVLRRTGWAVIVVSEGVRGPEGDLLTADQTAVGTDRFGHPQLGGAGRLLADAVSRALGVRVKYDRPGSLQRLLARYQSSVDRSEAWRAGAAAVRFALRGEGDVMAALQAEREPRYRSWFTAIPLEEVAGRERLLPAGLLCPADGYPGDGFRAYASPLTGSLPEFRTAILPLRRPAVGTT